MNNLYKKLKKSFNDVYITGKNTESSDVFWEQYSRNYTNKNMCFAGVAWTEKLLNPNTRVTIEESGYGFETTRTLRDLKNINIDLKLSAGTYLFQYSYIKKLPVIETTGSFGFNNFLNGSPNITSIEKLIIASGSTTFSQMFNGSKNSLRYIIFDGAINANISIVNALYLNRESFISFINVLSKTAKGKTATLSRAMINRFFETYANAGDGVTSDEWNDILDEYSNWTFSLS